MNCVRETITKMIAIARKAKGAIKEGKAEPMDYKKL